VLPIKLATNFKDVSFACLPCTLSKLPEQPFYNPVRRKQIVKSFGQLQGYSSHGTCGVSQDILAGEHHDRQETTIGYGNTGKEAIKAG
jgi:hypothetical protein